MCLVDLDFWKGIVEIFRDIALSAAAIFSALVAWRGLNRWKMEQSGKVYFEVARQLARATYKLRNSLNDARRVFTLSSEFPEDYDSMTHTPKEEADAWSHVFNNRFKPLYEIAVELQTAGLEAEVLWGEEAKQKVDGLLRCVTKLRVAMERHIREIADRTRSRPDRQEASISNDDIVFGSTEFTDQDNPFTEEVREKLNEMQEFLRQHLSKFQLEREGILWGLLHRKIIGNNEKARRVRAG